MPGEARDVRDPDADTDDHNLDLDCRRRSNDDHRDERRNHDFHHDFHHDGRFDNDSLDTDVDDYRCDDHRCDDYPWDDYRCDDYADDGFRANHRQPDGHAGGSDDPGLFRRCRRLDGSTDL